MEIEIGTLSIILIVGLLALISIGVPMGFASGFMGAVLVFLYIGEHAIRNFTFKILFSGRYLFLFICSIIYIYGLLT
jgi:hypothetical protein